MNKHNAISVIIDGIRFGSKREGSHYMELKVMQDAGAISSLETHPRFKLQEAFTDGSGTRHRAIWYVADFAYLDEHGDYCVEDVKGFETPVFKLKHKLLMHRYPGLKFRIVR